MGDTVPVRATPAAAGVPHGGMGDARTDGDAPWQDPFSSRIWSCFFFKKNVDIFSINHYFLWTIFS
jgi:hypothetical protein